MLLKKAPKIVEEPVLTINNLKYYNQDLATIVLYFIGVLKIPLHAMISDDQRNLRLLQSLNRVNLESIEFFLRLNNLFSQNTIFTEFGNNTFEEFVKPNLTNKNISDVALEEYKKLFKLNLYIYSFNYIINYLIQGNLILADVPLKGNLDFDILQLITFVKDEAIYCTLNNKYMIPIGFVDLPYNIKPSFFDNKF